MLLLATFLSLRTSLLLCLADATGYGEYLSDKCFFRDLSGPAAVADARTFSSSKMVIDSAAFPMRRSRAWTGSSSSDITSTSDNKIWKENLEE